MRGLVLGISAALAGPAWASDISFEDVSRAFPVEHVYSGGWEHFVGGGAAVFDCNGDAYPDVVAAGGEDPLRLFVNRTEAGGAITFGDGNLPNIVGATGAYPLDFDSDGWLDLFVLRVGANMILKGGPDCAFADATDEFGLASRNDWSTAFSAIWEEGNALPTLAIGNYVDRDDPDGPFEACADNLLYRPVGDRYGAPMKLTPGYCALSVLISDWRRDGQPDLRVSNDRHYYVRGGSEQMWRLHDLTLLDDKDGWDAVSIWGMGIASRDITGDGRPDVMLTSMGDQLLMVSDGASGFVQAPYETGATAHRPFVGDDGRPSTGWHAEFGDIDNDGLADLFIAKGNVDQMPSNAIHDPNNLLMQQGDGTFVEAAASAGLATTDRSRGAALADFDLDGRLDALVVNRRAPLELHRNVTEDTGHWLAIAPRQNGANRRAVGSWVELRADDGWSASQEVTIGGGHAGGSALPLHFGLGTRDAVEFRVLWPDGTASGWTEAKTGARIEAWKGNDGSVRMDVVN